MNEDREEILDRLEYFEDQEDFLTKLYSLCEAVIRSVPDTYDQIENNPQIFSSMNIEATVYLSELLMDAYELFKLQVDIAKDIKRTVDEIENIKRKIQKAEKV